MDFHVLINPRRVICGLSLRMEIILVIYHTFLYQLLCTCVHLHVEFWFFLPTYAFLLAEYKYTIFCWFQDTHNQAGIAHNGGLVPLLKLLDSKNGSLQHNAAFALYGLADNEVWYNWIWL